MKKLSLLLVTGLMALTYSCNLDSMDDPAWENTFIAKDKEKEIANGDLILYMRSTDWNPNKFYFTFITSSENYNIDIYLLGGEPFLYPINEKGILSFYNLISEGVFSVRTKESKEGVNPLGGELCRQTHCKLRIDCDVKQSGGYHELEGDGHQQLNTGNYREKKMKGDVKLKIVTEDGNNYNFSFNGIIPIMDTSEWIVIVD